MRRTPLLVLTAVTAAAVLAACGTSAQDVTVQTSTSSQQAASSPTSSAAPTPSTVAAPTPKVVPASAVPAVTGAQGSKPTVAKATQPAPTDVLVHDVIPGTGKTVAAGATVAANYTLLLYSSGTLVQSSYDTGSPFTFQAGAGRVIPGFDAGVLGMKAGGRREIVIPPVYGYGSQDNNGIPANSTLIFVVDVVSVS